MDGPLQVKVQPGTQSGRVVQLKDKGVPHLRGAGRGDQLVMVHVVTPETLTSEQKKLLDTLAKTLGPATMPKKSKGLFNRLKDALES